MLEEVIGRALPAIAGEMKDSQYDRLADWFGEHVNEEIFAKEYL